MTAANRTAPERVIEVLRQSPGRAVAAEHLYDAAELGQQELGWVMSRLRRCGWPIDGPDAGAWLLAVDADCLHEPVVKARLTTRWLGRHYLFAASPGSTNTEAATQAHGGAPHGLVVLANSQQEGRGRHGRKWASPPDVNLYLSVLLRPDWAVWDVPPVSLAASVGVANALARFLPDAPLVKWPNDLLWDGRKLCGILVEMTAEGGRIQHLIVGIGLNVNQLDFDPWVEGVATSMRRICEIPLCRTSVLTELLGQLEACLDRVLLGQTQQVLDQWCGLARWMGGTVSVRTGHRMVEGQAVGLSPRGALRVVDAEGHEHEVLAGDVTLRVR